MAFQNSFVFWCFRAILKDCSAARCIAKAVQTHLRWIQTLKLTNCFLAPEAFDFFFSWKTLWIPPIPPSSLPARFGTINTFALWHLPVGVDWTEIDKLRGKVGFGRLSGLFVMLCFCFQSNTQPDSEVKGSHILTWVMRLSKCFIASPVRLCTTSTMFQHSSTPKQDCPGHGCRLKFPWLGFVTSWAMAGCKAESIWLRSSCCCLQGNCWRKAWQSYAITMCTRHFVELPQQPWMKALFASWMKFWHCFLRAHTGNIFFSASQFDCRGYLWHSEEHPGSSCKSQRLAVELQRPFRLKLLRLTALLVAAELMLRCCMISIILNRCSCLNFLVISESKQWKLFQAQSSQPTGLEIAIPGWWKWRTGYDGYVDLFCSFLFNLYLFDVAGFRKNTNSVCVIIPRLFGDVLVEQCFERQDQMPELDIQLGAQCLRISQDQTE